MGGRGTRSGVAAAAALAVLGATPFLWVKPTNFRGYDEWLIVSLLSRGIVSFPYANRPLNLLWALPAWALAPDRLWGFLVVHAAWLTLSGVLVFLLVRRVAPGNLVLAFLAGAFTAVWAPSDPTRLASVQMIVYSGCTFGTLLSAWLLVEAWSRRRPEMALLAGTVGAATVLSVEAALPLLAMAPLLLRPGDRVGDWRRWGRWALAWLALVTAGTARALVPLLGATERLAYQTDILTLDLSPGHVLRRTIGQLRHHLLPLVDSPIGELAVAAVPLVVALFLAGWWLFSRMDEARSIPSAAGLALAGLAGLGWAILAYAPFLLDLRTRGPVRTQFFSAPGIGLLLAASVLLIATPLPVRARPAATALLGAWVVAVGTGRTLALQRAWDAESAYPAQRETLLQIAAATPDLAPGTLVVLLQGQKVWPYDFSFRHAVDYLYEGRARGHATGAEPLLYETRFEGDGVVSEPAPVLRDPWREVPIRYLYEDVVVFAEDARGRVFLLDEWPPELPPLPPDAAYSPRARLRGSTPPSRLSIRAPRPGPAGGVPKQP